MARTYRGSCHCGAVRFACELDLATSTSRCNCSICRKTRFWKSLVKAENVRLEQGADVLTDYQFGSDTIHHLFCSRCGVKPFGRALFDMTFEGEVMKGEYYAINIACLDDASDAELAAAQIRYENGRDDDWTNRPAEIRHL